jgi:hypothetical protein
MKGTKLLLLPLVIGIVLMVYSWYLSYPLAIDSPNDFVFNHVSVLYWFGLPILLTSLFMIALTSESNFSKWICSVGIVVTIYSMSYFYSMLPGADSQFFRGLTEYFIKTKNLNPLQPNHDYYQWPSFFILGDIATSVSGLKLANFEFLLYTLIGFLLATTLHVYAFKAYKNSGYLAVMAFFISMFYILNYQDAPFSLALSILCLLFMLETRQSGHSSIIAMVVLFTSISITHAFVPLFFVLYLLMRSILNRSKRYRNLGLLTLTIYFLVQFTEAPVSFAQNIIGVMTWGSEYSGITETTLAPVSVPIDVIAQTLSRTVTIAFVMICVAGFILVLIKRKMRALDKAILLTGVLYSLVGVFLYTLGSRAIPLAFIPISLGAAYLLESRLRPYLACVILILLILLPSIAFHDSFTEIFQPKETYSAENFFIDTYNWTNRGLILANFRAITYLASKQTSDVFIADSQAIKEVDTIFYTIRLGTYFLQLNYSMDKTVYEEKLDTIYNNGFSYVATRSWNFTWAPKK